MKQLKIRTVISALLIAFFTAAIIVAAPMNPEVIAKLVIGKWQGGRHLTQYLPNHTFLMDSEPGDTPRGTWQLDGDKLLKTFSEGGTDVYTIISINKTEMIIQSAAGKKSSLLRVE